MTQYSEKGNGTGLPSGPEPCLYHRPLHPTNAFLVQFSVHTAHKSTFLHLLHFFLPQKFGLLYRTGYAHQHTQGGKINSPKAALTPLTLCQM